MRYFLPLLLLVLPLPAAAVEEPVNLPVPAELRSRLLTEDPKAVIAELYASGQWDRLLNEINAGKPEWIRQVPVLARGTDAGTSEDLEISLAFALPIAARDVLSVIDEENGPLLGVSRICTVPFIEQAESDFKAYRRRAIWAVMRVKTEGLEEVRDACLEKLKAAHL